MDAKNNSQYIINTLVLIQKMNHRILCGTPREYKTTNARILLIHFTFKSNVVAMDMLFINVNCPEICHLNKNLNK